jgi:hypothetical protein
LAVLASPFKSKSRLEALGGFTIVTSGLSFRYVLNGQDVVYRYNPKATAESVRLAFDFLDSHVKETRQQ